MTTRKYSSRAQQTTLTSGITSGDVTMTVGSGANLMGGKTPAVGETYTVVIDPDTALEEIVDVSNYASGNTLTIARGIDGSTGVAHSAGAIVRHMVIGRDLSEANTHIENTTTAHGITLANLIKTTDTGTVTSTMITDGTILNADINASAGIVDTKLATISTASKVSNSATTAASANTASAIVARDASGNFTAGTITANLTGTASAATLAATATALATGRTISLTGDVTGTTGSFDGTGNATMTSAIAAGVIVNADINASAAIDKTKISGTAVTLADTGTVTGTMIASDTIVNADINTAAAIAYSKLNLNGTITSADIVDGTIVNGDINASAAIDWTKLGISSTVSSTEIGYVDGVTSAIQTQLDAKLPKTGGTMSGAIAMGTSKITGMGDPTLAQDAATKAYVDLQRDNLINSAPGIYDTLGEIATAIQSGGTFYDSLVLKSGSTMTGALTLSGAPTVDLHAATKLYVDGVAGSATAAAASATAAAASYDSFDDRYLGAKSSAPTLDNDGNSLVTGALYWNSVSSTMFAWTGSAWGSISSSAAIYRYKFVAAGGETSVSGADASSQTLAYIAGYEQVYLNGVLLVRGTDYTATNGTSITALAALVVNDVLEIITFTALSVVTDIPQSIVDAKGDLVVGTAADTVGRLGVGTNGQVLNADSTAGTGLAWVTPVTASSTTTFTNKTLTSPTIGSGATHTGSTSGSTVLQASAVASGTLTLPAATDTLVGKATTDTLTNKTLTSPVLTTPSISTIDAKGDLLAGTADNTIDRIAVGANDTVLTADSTAATGLKWATPSSGGMTLISTTTLTGASVTLSSIPATYVHLQLVIRNFKPATDASSLRMRYNSDAGASRYKYETGTVGRAFGDNYIGLVASANDNSVATGLSIANIFDYTNSATWKLAQLLSLGVDATTTANFNADFGYGFYNQITAISSIDLFPSAGNFTSGTVLLYGVK